MKILYQIIAAVLIINSALSTNATAQTNLINKDADIKIQGGYLVLKNTKLINENNFNASGGTVIITGDATNPQSAIGGSDISSFYNLQINKTANGASVENKIVVNNQLTLTNGNLVLDFADLIILNSGSISGGSTNSYIQTTGLGVLKQEVGNSNIAFPIGNQSYTPVMLNNTGVTNNFKVRVENIVYDNGTSGNEITTDVVDATWYIAEEISGSSDVTATFQWNASDEMTNFDRTQAFVSNYENGTWDTYPPMAAAGNNPYTLTRSMIQSFSPFRVVSMTSPPSPPGIPTLGQWGLINLALLLMICGTLHLLQPTFQK